MTGCLWHHSRGCLQLVPVHVDVLAIKPQDHERAASGPRLGHERAGVEHERVRGASRVLLPAVRVTVDYDVRVERRGALAQPYQARRAVCVPVRHHDAVGNPSASGRRSLVVRKLVHGSDPIRRHVNRELVRWVRWRQRHVVVAVHKVDGLGQVELLDRGGRHLQVPRDHDGVNRPLRPRRHDGVLKVPDARVDVRADHQPDHVAPLLAVACTQCSREPNARCGWHGPATRAADLLARGRGVRSMLLPVQVWKSIAG